MPHVSELHAQHDPLLVASLAAGDLSGADRDHASAQIASCADCAVLHADLIAISRATAALPPAVAPRDFRLSPEQAAALRPVGWRRLVAAIGGSRPLMSRQLGIGLATMGLAGLLVSTLPGIQLGAASPAGSGSRTGATILGESGGESNGLVGVAGDAASAAPAYAGAADQAGSPSAARAAPAASGAYSDSSAAQGSAVSPGGTPETAEGGNVFGANSTSKAESDNLTSLPLLSDDGAAPSDGGRGLLVAGSVVLLVVGIALLVMRRLVRRPSWS